MWGQKQQWISHKINIRHPWQLKKSKSWEPFWSYQLKSTANQAHLPQNWARLTVQLVTPRILIFLIAMGAEYLSYVKSIATFASTFYGYIIYILASVWQVVGQKRSKLCPRSVTYFYFQNHGKYYYDYSRRQKQSLSPSPFQPLEGGKVNLIDYCTKKETTLRVGHFTTTSGHFSDNCINIFHKTGEQRKNLRCLTCLNLNWIKSYDI